MYMLTLLCRTETLFSNAKEKSVKHIFVFILEHLKSTVPILIFILYLSIMDFLRGQYVIYGPVRIILIEDEV